MNNNINIFIQNILHELSSRLKDGIPNLNRKEDLNLLRSILIELNYAEVSDDIIKNLMEGGGGEPKKEEPPIDLTDKEIEFVGKDEEDLQAKIDYAGLTDMGFGFYANADGKVVYKKDESGLKLVPANQEEFDDVNRKIQNDKSVFNSKVGDEYLNKLPKNDPAKSKVESINIDDIVSDIIESFLSENIKKNIILEAAFTPIELAKVKYQSQWIDHIKNGKPFQLEPYGEIVIDKSFLNSKGYGDKTIEQVLNNGTKEDIEKFFKDGNSFGTIIPSIDGKKYKLTDISKSTFTGQGGGEIPKDAAYYEMGICVEYNKLKGMNISDAMNAASVDPKKYQKYENHLTEVCSKIAKNLPSVGGSLKQTGGDSFKPAPIWPSPDGTPKTDIYGGPSYRISVKKSGGSQLTSGKGGDAKGLFLAGLAFYETYSSSTATKYLQNVISKIETDFKSFNTDNEVGKVRDTATESYIKWRVPQIKNKSNAKEADIIKHAKGEAISVGISPGTGANLETWFLDGVDVLTDREIMKWFEDYWKTQGTKQLQEEARDIINAAINHKKLDAEIKNAFNDTEFKKWVVYEAASGNFKFSGNPDLNTVNDAVANKILVFDLNGGVKLTDIDANWASGYASHVTPSVNFKSSGRQKYTALRLVQESKNYTPTLFENDVMSIINEELISLNYLIKESVQIVDKLITEINFKHIYNKLKKIAKNLIEKIVNNIKNFYNNVIKNVINKLKEYIKLGINKFLEYIGIEIDGTANLNISF